MHNKKNATGSIASSKDLFLRKKLNDFSVSAVSYCQAQFKPVVSLNI